MKCTICGSKKLFQTNIIDDCCTEGHVYQSVIAYACEECGHVELFISSERIQKYKDLKKQTEELNAKIEKLTAEIKLVSIEIQNLKDIIGDENQTVKAVNESKSKIYELENKQGALNSELRACKEKQEQRASSLGQGKY